MVVTVTINATSTVTANATAAVVVTVTVVAVFCHSILTWEIRAERQTLRTATGFVQQLPTLRQVQFVPKILHL